MNGKRIYTNVIISFILSHFFHSSFLPSTYRLSPPGAESGVFGAALEGLVQRDITSLPESPLEAQVPLVFYKVSHNTLSLWFR